MNGPIQNIYRLIFIKLRYILYIPLRRTITWFAKKSFISLVESWHVRYMMRWVWHFQLCGIIQLMDSSIINLGMLVIANQDQRSWNCWDWSWGRCWCRLCNQRFSTSYCGVIGELFVSFNVVQVDNIISGFYMGHFPIETKVQRQYWLCHVSEVVTWKMKCCRIVFFHYRIPAI